MPARRNSGRRNVPVQLHVLRGNPSKHTAKELKEKALADDNFDKLQGGMPDCPLQLKGHAKKEWYRITPLLQKAGVLASTDLLKLAQYCKYFAGWMKAFRRIDKEGYVVFGKRGSITVAPWYKQMIEFDRLIHLCMIEFGMTPASRAKLMLKPKESEDEEEKFWKNRKTKVR